MSEETIVQSDTTFVVKQKEFVGPIGKLLELIENRKLIINDISLAEIADDFIRYANTLSSISVSNKISFISIASVLLLIKSKSLLPGINLTEDEENKIDDLKYRLYLLEVAREGTIEIATLFGKTQLHIGEQRIVKEPVFSPHASITVKNIFAAVSHVLESVPVKKEENKEVLIEKVISLEEMIADLESRIFHDQMLSFSSLSKGGRSVTKEEKLNTIIVFLAMLELLRQGIIDVKEENDGDFIINKRNEEEQQNELGN